MEEEKEAPTPTRGGNTASATPQPAPHSFTDSDKEGAPPRPWRSSQPQSHGTQGSGPPRGHGACAGGGGVFNYPPRTASPSPARAGEGRGLRRDVDGRDTHDLSGF